MRSSAQWKFLQKKISFLATFGFPKTARERDSSNDAPIFGILSDNNYSQLLKPLPQSRSLFPSTQLPETEVSAEGIPAPEKSRFRGDPAQPSDFRPQIRSDRMQRATCIGGGDGGARFVHTARALDQY